MKEQFKTNVKQGWKTTLVGIFLFSAGLGLFIDQRENLTTTNSIVFGAMCICGIVFWFLPDSFISSLKKYLEKYAEK